MDVPLNVFTLNCWGIPFISKNRKERFEAIAQYLSASPHNVVCLQEVWSETDYFYLKDNLKSILPYSHYFYSGVLGSGLCVFSKWVILDEFFYQWPLNGYIHKIQHGDWFGGKGVGLCYIMYGTRLVNIYCTHLHAEYHEDDIYLAHRVLQAYSTAKFVNMTSASSDISLLVGDFNTAPGDLSYRSGDFQRYLNCLMQFRLLTTLPKLIDPYDTHCENCDPNVRKEAGTADCTNNSYSNKKEVKKNPEGKRIDHILFNAKRHLNAKVINFGNPMKDKVPGHKFSYSDHNAVCLEIQLSDCVTSKEAWVVPELEDVVVGNVEEAIKVCEEAQYTVQREKKMFLLAGGLLLMLLLGTVGLWTHWILHDIVRILVTAVSMYYFVMGTIWNRIEANSLKSGLGSMNRYIASAKNKLE